MNERMQNSDGKHDLYGGIVWVVSAVALIIYGTVSFFNVNVPGVVELISFLGSIEGKYIFIAAFVAVFIEGLYFVGNFFPGSSTVIILAVLSRINSLPVFLFTIILIFLGWCLAGIVNIYIAKTYRAKVIKLSHDDLYHVSDRVFTTWFPAFRASYEVAQVVEGGNPTKVFLSSVKVRFLASLFVGALAYVIPFFFDIKSAGEEEGFASVLVVAAISGTVGFLRIKKFYSKS